jgi:hypothetical protein
MNLSARLLPGLAIGAVVLAGMIATPATAQDKGKEAKPAKAEKGMAKMTTLLDNDKVRVIEVQYKPGDQNKAVASSAYRVLRALKGGTITRTYADGKTEKIEYKTGEVKFLEPYKTGYTAKNTGKSDIHFYVVQLK